MVKFVRMSSMFDFVVARFEFAPSLTLPRYGGGRDQDCSFLSLPCSTGEGRVGALPFLACIS
jgi:hypothetical protein